MCPIFVIKFSGVSDLQGVKVPDFPLTLLVILTTVLRYRAACDIINCIRYYCLSYKQCIRGWKFIPIKIRAIPIPIPIQGDFHSFPCIPIPTCVTNSHSHGISMGFQMGIWNPIPRNENPIPMIISSHNYQNRLIYCAYSCFVCETLFEDGHTQL